MPTIEHYEIEVEATITIIVGGRAVSQFTASGDATCHSDELLSLPIPAAVAKALDAAKADAVEMAEAARLNRRRRLGYKDGD
jgi:hypothetical protein